MEPLALAGWTYDLRLELSLHKAHYDVRFWHPAHGTLAVDSWSSMRDPGAVTAQYVASSLWTGATEFLERTTGA